MTIAVIKEHSYGGKAYSRYVVDYTVTETQTNYSITATMRIQCRTVSSSATYGIADANGQPFMSMYIQTTSSNRKTATFSENNYYDVRVSTNWTNVASTSSVTLSVSKSTTATQTLTIGFTNTSDISVLSVADWNASGYLSSYSESTASSNMPSKTVATLTIQKVTYTVSYNANGGSGAPSNQTKTAGVSLTLSTTKPTRAGYSFKRWNTNTTDSGTAYNPGASYTANAALSLYAIWNRTVTYNANGGTGAPASQTAIATSAITLSSTAPTKAGSTFRGWGTSSTATATSYQPGGTYPANSPSITLYAVWWENPSITTPTVTRCDSQGNEDACGGYVKVSVPWSITASQVGETQTGLSTFSITVAGNSQTFSNNTVPSGTSGTRTVILGGGSVNPSMAYTVTVTATDAHGSTTNTSTLAADSSYTLPAISNVTITLVDSNGVADVLGKRVRITASYSVYETSTQTVASSLSASITHNASDAEAKQNLSASGTETWTFGPYGYGIMDPHGGYAIGKISLSDNFNTTNYNLTLSTTAYANPTITAISTYRVEAVEEGGVTTYEEADDGTCLGIDLDWTITRTASQSDPSSILVVVRDIDAADAQHEVVAVRGYEPTGSSATFYIYPDSQQWPDDVVIGGELINTAHRYTVDVTLSDLYSDEVASAVAVRSDMVTVAYFTMDFLAGGHGIAIGKPSTREMLDVSMQAQFDLPIQVADQVSLPTYTFATLPQQGDIPTGPAIVLTLDDFGLYYYDGDPQTN